MGIQKEQQYMLFSPVSKKPKPSLQIIFSIIDTVMWTLGKLLQMYACRKGSSDLNQSLFPSIGQMVFFKSNSSF